MIDKNTIDRDSFIEDHMAFIIKVTGRILGRYVSLENDEEFSIALAAFDESIDRYDEERGDFLSFAALVMESRLRTYVRREKNCERCLSIEEMEEAGRDIPDMRTGPGREDLLYEIDEYRRDLRHFGLDLEMLADSSPRHADTRENAVAIGQRVSEDRPTVDRAYEKRRLPVRMTARLAKVSEKVVRRSRALITAAMIIFVKDLRILRSFITGTVR